MPDSNSNKNLNFPRSSITSKSLKEAVSRLIKVLGKPKNVYISFIFYDELRQKFRQVGSINTEKLFATSQKFYINDSRGGLYYAHEAIRKLETKIGYNLSQGPWPVETKKVAQKEKIKSVISTPLIRNSRPFGVINFFFSRELGKNSTTTKQLVANCELTAFSLVQLLENLELRKIEENTSSFLRHEIPHMLSDIETFAERQLLRLKDKKDVEEEALQKISLHSKQASALIFNIGTEQRWFLKGIELRKSYTELHSFLEKNVIGTYEGMGIGIKKHFHSDPAEVYIDHGLMERAIANIIQNAVKHSLPSKPIEVSTKRVRNTIEITILNYGPTIPKDKREEVFNKFYQIELKAYRIGQHGGGLGLFISKAIIESHGGRIFIEKPRGKSGCEVHVLLPVNKH